MVARGAEPRRVPGHGRTLRGLGRALPTWVPLVLSLSCASLWREIAGAAEAPSAAARQQAFADQARRHYLDAQAQAEKNPLDVQVLCRLARACFDYADYSTSNQQREDLALSGIAAARSAITNNAQSALAHYCLALNLGQLARTRTLTALKIVRQMESSFLGAIALDPAIDHAGPHRALGVLYQDAPGWPVSIGSRKNARLHFDKAIQIHPAYPGSRLCLLEGLLKWDQLQAARDRLQITHQVLLSARATLTGPAWAASWDEWDHRWHAITNRLASLGSHK